MTTTPLASFPPPERWDDWTELDASAWPERKEHHYIVNDTLVSTAAGHACARIRHTAIFRVASRQSAGAR